VRQAWTIWWWLVGVVERGHIKLVAAALADLERVLDLA
jgi:hypothetical protein